MDIRVHRTKSCLLPRQLKVRDVMTPNPLSVSPETPAGEVARLLLSANFNGVPVVDSQNKPVGIITQGDLINRAQMPVRLGLLQEMDRDQVHTLFNSMSQRSAREIMSHPAVTVGADEALVGAVELMLKKAETPAGRGPGRRGGGDAGAAGCFSRHRQGNARTGAPCRPARCKSPTRASCATSCAGTRTWSCRTRPCPK